MGASIPNPDANADAIALAHVIANTDTVRVVKADAIWLAVGVADGVADSYILHTAPDAVLRGAARGRQHSERRFLVLHCARRISFHVERVSRRRDSLLAGS